MPPLELTRIWGGQRQRDDGGDNSCRKVQNVVTDSSAFPASTVRGYTLVEAT
jgi:hypothetical protein